MPPTGRHPSRPSSAFPRGRRTADQSSPLGGSSPPGHPATRRCCRDARTGPGFCRPCSRWRWPRPGRPGSPVWTSHRTAATHCTLGERAKTACPRGPDAPRPPASWGCGHRVPVTAAPGGPMPSKPGAGRLAWAVGALAA